jgi:putative phosphoesterase
MRLGLVSDIHSSYGSLIRAFDRLAERGVDRVVCMGDIVHKSNDEEGEGVIRLLQEEWIVCVRGNHDVNAVRRAREEGDLGALSAGAVDWLEELPAERVYVWEGVRICVAHAAPLGLDMSVWTEIPKPLKRAMRTMEHDVVLLGHTHVPMKIAHRDTWLINPGSIIGTRTRDSHTCAVLALPSCELEVLSLDDGCAISFATG